MAPWIRATSALAHLYMAAVAALSAHHYWRARGGGAPALPRRMGTFMFVNMALFSAFMAAAVVLVLFFPGALGSGVAHLTS